VTLHQLYLAIMIAAWPVFRRRALAKVSEDIAAAIRTEAPRGSWHSAGTGNA